MHNYQYEVIIRLPNGAEQVFRGTLGFLHSEAEARAALKRQYSLNPIISIEVWEV